MTRRGRKYLGADIVVIGSGAGGAITGATLAEGGRDVLILEEGPQVDHGAIVSHSTDAVRLLYRNGGITPILGNAKIAFVEGRCVGGGTEINSGFWQRVPEETVYRWTEQFSIRDLSYDELSEMYKEIESELSPVVIGTGTLPQSSRVFKNGADSLGLEANEIPRVQSGDPNDNIFVAGTRRSMSRTYLPRALKAGAELRSGCRVTRLRIDGDRVVAVEADQIGPDGLSRIEIAPQAVFICGGAVQTPVLLRAAGIKRNVGSSLRIHPMVKVAAKFDTDIDSHESSLPVFQIALQNYEITLGGAVFSPGFLAVALADAASNSHELMSCWRRFALYYVACKASGRGTVRGFPGTHEAIIRYDLTDRDIANLRSGMLSLAGMLFAAGAQAVYPGIFGGGPVTTLDQARALVQDIAPSALSISTVHAFSSCPMGEKMAVCATDSVGRMHGFANLYVGDASLIPDSPGVNPQGSVMALALRNARRFLSE